MRDTDYQPPPRRTAQAPARGGVGDRIADYAAERAKAGATWAGHTALDLTVAGAKAAAHHPKEFAPPVAAGILFGAGDAASHEPAIGWPMLFTALVIAGFLIHQRGQRDAHGILRRAYYALAYTAALVWLTTAAVLSPTDPFALEMLAAATATASVSWWARHLRRRERLAAEPAPEQDEFAAVRAEITAWWNENAATDRGFAPDSRLLGVRADGLGAYLDVQLDAKRQSYDDLASLITLKRIAALRGTSRQMIDFERWDDQREDRARITIFTTNVLQENVPFPGPAIDLDTGCATVGRRINAKDAHLRIWQPKSGTNMEVVVGCSGSGKSRYLDQVLLCERHAKDPLGRHLIVSWICDPQEGQSLPDWQDRVDRFARGTVEGLAMLEDAFAEMIARNKLLSQFKWFDDKGREHKGLSYYDPKEYARLGIDDMPILSITIDEAPMVLAHPRAKWLIERLVSMGRKCAIRLRLVTQIPSIAELGNSFTIRPLLASMSVVCLRTDDAITSGAFPKLPGDPRLLEEQFPDGSKTFGLGYILGADRPSKFRTFYLDDNAVFDWAEGGTTAHLTALATAADQAEAESAAAAAAANPTPGEPQDAPEPVGVRSARELIRAYLADHPGHVTSGTLVHELGLNNSTVSQALARDTAAGKILKVTHGVYAAIGTDPGLWREERAMAA